MEKPSVSIVVPCYNQAQYLDECLQSVLDQNYKDWECIIVNDGSPDGTEEVALKWVQKDDRFKYFYKENGGLSSTRNFGINMSDGEFVIPLDADDKISSDYLLLALKEIQSDPDIKVVYSKAEKFGDECGAWNLPSFEISKLGMLNMIFCSALYRKEDWKRVGGYDDNMIFGLEDWEFWIAILKDVGKVSQIDHVGFFYRMKIQSMLKEMDDFQKRFLYEYISVKHADFYVKHHGSFIALNAEIEVLKKEGYIKGGSKKKVLNAFFKAFFGFYLFKRR